MNIKNKPRLLVQPNEETAVAGVSTMTVSCIDISHHQGSNIDFDAVRESGVVAMIHKATEGTGFVDDMRESNTVAAMGAGIACCTYHWLSPGSDPVKQMQFYLDTIQPDNGERLVIDYEQDGCTLDQLEAAITYLLGDDRNFKITVYSGHLLKEQLGDDHNEFLANNTDLWLAQYSSEENISWPSGTYNDWTLWQYSETGTISGIHDNYVDLNKFNGSDDELVEWISPAGAEPRSKEVVIDITAPEDILVSILINGERV